MRKFYPPNLVPTCEGCHRVLKRAEAQRGVCSACGANFSPGLGLRVSCARCGYDLRGTPDHCPECAMPVDATMAALGAAAHRRAVVKRTLSSKSDGFRYVVTWMAASLAIVVGFIVLWFVIGLVANMFRRY